MFRNLCVKLHSMRGQHTLLNLEHLKYLGEGNEPAVEGVPTLGGPYSRPTEPLESSSGGPGSSCHSMNNDKQKVVVRKGCLTNPK